MQCLPYRVIVIAMTRKYLPHKATRFERLLWVPMVTLAEGIGGDYDPVGQGTTVEVWEDGANIDILHNLGRDSLVGVHIRRNLENQIRALVAESRQQIGQNTVAVSGSVRFVDLSTPTQQEELWVTRRMRMWPVFAALAGAQPAPTPEQMAVVAGSNLEF